MLKMNLWKYYSFHTETAKSLLQIIPKNPYCNMFLYSMDLDRETFILSDMWHNRCRSIISSPSCNTYSSFKSRFFHRRSAKSVTRYIFIRVRYIPFLPSISVVKHVSRLLYRLRFEVLLTSDRVYRVTINTIADQN